MYIYNWADVMSASRIFHSSNYGELVEALERHHDDDADRDLRTEPAEIEPEMTNTSVAS